MGIGLADGKVNMNRLPGWEDKSYGYHGDDGHSFCSSGNGQPYGPTFTTGDVIGKALFSYFSASTTSLPIFKFLTLFPPSQVAV